MTKVLNDYIFKSISFDLDLIEGRIKCIPESVKQEIALIKVDELRTIMNLIEREVNADG